MYFFAGTDYPTSPLYDSMISDKMCVDTLTKKLRGGEYKTFDPFFRDIRLIFSNAIRYNKIFKDRVVLMEQEAEKVAAEQAMYDSNRPQPDRINIHDQEIKAYNSALLMQQKSEEEITKCIHCTAERIGRLKVERNMKRRKETAVKAESKRRAIEREAQELEERKAAEKQGERASCGRILER
jgi:hypothetical protein